MPLTARGELEALDAAASLRASGVCVDVVYTSTLKRTVKTAWLVLEALDRFTVPIHHRALDTTACALGAVADQMHSQHQPHDTFHTPFPPP